jgi:hypothetical protein
VPRTHGALLLSSLGGMHLAQVASLREPLQW